MIRSIGEEVFLCICIVFLGVVREGLFHKVTFEQRSSMATVREQTMRLSKGTASIKFQSQEHAWGCSRNGSGIHVAGAQWMRRER